MGFCSQTDVEEFLHTVPEFERMLVRSGIILVKYWFSITDPEQNLRFLMRPRSDEAGSSPMDLESRRRWEEYTKAGGDAGAHPHPEARWWVVEGNSKRKARLNSSIICCCRCPTAMSSTSQSCCRHASTSPTSPHPGTRRAVRAGGLLMDFFRRFTFLFCAPAFDAEDLEGHRLNEITIAIERLGFQVIRARRIEDAEMAVQTDAAIGCMVVDWGKKGLEGKTADLINLMRRRGLEMPIVMLVRRKRLRTSRSRF